MSAEALGADAMTARTRAVELNATADAIRLQTGTVCNGPLPGSCARLFADFKASEEFIDLKPRTRRDYAYYLEKIEIDFGRVMVRSLTPKVLKTFYKRARREKSVTWAYHILGTFRAVLTWAVSEDWIKNNPALDVSIKSPKKRDVVWLPEHAAIYVAQAALDGWHSIVAMAHVFDSIGQSPIDVRTLRRKAYDGQRIHTTREKTGAKGAPILLLPEAKRALDQYLDASPKLPDAPLFTNDRIGGEWNESTLQHKHAAIRKAAGLPKELQLQDFRTTAQTEGGAAGGTVDELRGLARHSTRAAGEHYVHPNSDYVDSIQSKRMAFRNKKAKKVGM